MVLNVNHHDVSCRPYPTDAAPLSPRTTEIGDGLASLPFQIHCYDCCGGDERRVKPITDPLGSILANGVTWPWPAPSRSSPCCAATTSPGEPTSRLTPSPRRETTTP